MSPNTNRKTRSIGIMSMHRIFNYGSFLQGYGLKQILHSLDPDASINFLDYRPGPPLVRTSEESPRMASRIVKKLASYNKVGASLSDKLRFFNHKRLYARKNFPVLGLSPEPNYNYAVDLQVVGSDEVFNCVQSNTNVGYSRDLFGHKTAAKRLISYAGSFGNTTLEKIAKYGLTKQLSEDFSNFDDISVRDENSKTIIQELTGRTPYIHVDPVLAYDYMNLCDRIPEHRIVEEPYLIAYGYSGRFTHSENAAVRRYAKANGLKVICIGGIQGCCDRFVDCNPFEVLALFRDAQGIVTDTFHGSIFSIINKKKFLTIIRKSKGDGYGNEEKLRYLLNSLGLGDRGSFAADSASIEQALSGEIDYSRTVDFLDAARADAYSYLRKNVI